MSNTIKHVQGDRYPVVTITLRDANTTNSDPSDPETWDVINLSANVSSVRVDYYQAKITLKNVTVSASADTITHNGSVVGTTDALDHGLLDGDRVRFQAETTMPTGLVETTLYFVVSSQNIADDGVANFKVSTTRGGSAVDITDTGSGQINVVKQYDSTAGTLVGDGSAGQFTFSHPNKVWSNPGDYDLEYVVVRTSPAGNETVEDRDILELRPR